MTTSLCFSPVTRDNQPWFKSSDLARALGYSSEKAVANIYRRNEDEFSNDMSVVINSSTTGIPALHAGQCGEDRGIASSRSPFPVCSASGDRRKAFLGVHRRDSGGA